MINFKEKDGLSGANKTIQGGLVNWSQFNFSLAGPLSENQKLSFFSMECHGSSGKQVIWEIPSRGIADDVGY